MFSLTTSNSINGNLPAQPEKTEIEQNSPLTSDPSTGLREGGVEEGERKDESMIGNEMLEEPQETDEAAAAVVETVQKEEEEPKKTPEDILKETDNLNNGLDDPGGSVNVTPHGHGEDSDIQDIVPDGPSAPPEEGTEEGVQNGMEGFGEVKKDDAESVVNEESKVSQEQNHTITQSGDIDMGETQVNASSDPVDSGQEQVQDHEEDDIVTFEEFKSKMNQEVVKPQQGWRDE